MKTTHNTPTSQGFTRREGLLTLVGGVMTLAGCGGGGSSGVATVGGGTTGSFALGPIAGLGSIICSGVRFNDDLARVLDDDGGLRNRNELKLGMMVRVKSKSKKVKTANSTSADADEISFRSELLGPIDSISSPQTTPATLKVLGQTVRITVNTIFDEGLSLAALIAGDIVEVHGFLDPGTNALMATRIERKDPAKVNAFKLTGTVKTLSTTAKTFNIGTLTISYATTSDVPANLANDQLVRVRLATTPATGTRTALRVRAVEAEVEDREEAEVKGTITEFTSSAKFKVNGLQVDASGATVPAGLKLGDQVEVEGRLVNGVLVAKTVEVENQNEKREFELHGIVSNKTSSSFTVTSVGGVAVKVNYTNAVTFSNGTATNLINGAKVEVKGVTSADGTTIDATRISFE